MKQFVEFIKQINKIIFQSLVKALFVLLPLFATFVIYSNSFETIFQKDFTVLAQAIDDFSPSSDYLDEFRIVEAPNLTGNAIGDYGKPLILSVPSVNRRLEIVPAIKDGNIFLNRPNNAHYLVSENENKEIETIVMYISKSWRTIPSVEQIETGTNLYIDTNREWRYVFQIDEKVEIDLDTYFAPLETRTQLILVIKDPETNRFYAVRATYRTIISI